MKPLDWHGLYSDSWGKSIVPEAYAHPAKYARGLIRAIYQHALAQEYLAPGDTVIDPFGGVALGAMDALRYGLNWTGVELEPRFVALGQANIELWNAQFAHHFPGWGTARLLQGDSRQLCQVVRDAATVVSSPPYANMADKWNEGPGARFDPIRHPGKPQKQSNDNGYGSTEGNLGNMGEGNGFAAAISSPPFVQSIAGDARDRGGILGQRQGNINLTNGGNLGRSLLTEYGNTPGQLGSMPEVSVKHQIPDANYETFWSAAALIVAQAYQVLKPGGVSIWVCKDFVRNKKRVPFSDQWQALCEAVGFVPVERIRAWVIEHNGTQMGMFGEDKEHLIERKSFFRRLAERKGSPRIDWEDVIILRKP